MNFLVCRSVCISWTFTLYPFLFLRNYTTHSLSSNGCSHLRRHSMWRWKNSKRSDAKLFFLPQILGKQYQRNRLIKYPNSPFICFPPYKRQRQAFYTSTFIKSKKKKEDNDCDNKNDNNYIDKEKKGKDNHIVYEAPHSSSVNSPKKDPAKSFFEKVDRDWEKAWEKQVTPWDVGKAAPPLVSLLKDKIIAPCDASRESKVLIPGCGTGYELIAFAKAGFDHVEGVDISSTAIRMAEERLEQIISADSSLSEASKQDIKNRISLRVGDFFGLRDRYNIIFDYTFCVALPPGMRLEWARQMKRLLDPGSSELITLIFPVPSEHNLLNSNFKMLDTVQGPPYDVSPSLYSYLLREENDMECIDLRPCLNSIKPRQGKEWIGRWKLRS